MKFKIIIFLSIIIGGALLQASSGVQTLEEELYWYQSHGFNIYSLKYIDLLDELPLNRTVSENVVSRINLRGWVRKHDGILYYDKELQVLYSVEIPDLGAWVYVYFNDIETWSTYWHTSERISILREDYYIAK